MGIHVLLAHDGLENAHRSPELVAATRSAAALPCVRATLSGEDTRVTDIDVLNGTVRLPRVSEPFAALTGERERDGIHLSVLALTDVGCA